MVKGVFSTCKTLLKNYANTFENPAITQHKDTLRYVIIQSGGYRPSIRRFHVGDCLFATDCTDDIGCNGRSHYLMSAKGVSFWNSHVGRS